MKDRSIILPSSEVPQKWYNVLAEFPGELPPAIHPGTKKPLTPEDLAPIFPMSLIKQEMVTDKWVEIPDDVMDALKIWRSTPLVRAVHLEKALKTNARIYYKNESVSPAGSHKLNTAVAQAYYNKAEGVKRLSTETGAGQWGSSLAFACQRFGMECTVYMVKVSYHAKPYRKSLMRVWGAKVFASPSPETAYGKKVLAEDPNNQGSLGLAISEAVEDAATHSDTNYSLGSVLNHVLLHQTIIGLETKKQLETAGEKADILIGCVGGGSNFAGFVTPFISDKLKGANIRMIAVEPAACPTITKGLYEYDFGDTAQLTPLLKMYTLGHDFMPPGIHAGGLRYHGMAPVLSFLVKKGLVEAQSTLQRATFEAGVLFSKTEGILPAPESCHAIKVAIDEAKKNKGNCIVFNLSGHGHFDLSSYDNYLDGKLEDFEYPEELAKKALKNVPKVE